MRFWSWFRSLFTLGFFKETRRRNKLKANWKVATIFPQKGCYLKPGAVYEQTFQEMLKQNPESNLSWYTPRLDPVTGITEVVYHEEPLAIQKQEEFWLITDLVVDEDGYFKFQFIGPSQFGWSSWMDLDAFSQSFQIVSTNDT